MPEPEGLDLDHLFATGVLERPPEHMVRAEMRKMGVPVSGDQDDLLAAKPYRARGRP